MEINWELVIGEALTQLLKIFIPLFIALILKWAGEFYLKIKEKNPDLARLIAIAGEIGYSSAEEYFHNKEYSGDDKLNYAIQSAEEYLKEHGIFVDLNVIKDAIINYGVSEHKFSWQWKEFEKLMEQQKEETDE